jgi:sporulation protein YlmC with PRC-barrel domain
VADPVSYLLIEPGWRVVDADGRDVGRVEEVLADLEQDIFHGLRVGGREITAAEVAEIVEGLVRLRSASR